MCFTNEGTTAIIPNGTKLAKGTPQTMLKVGAEIEVNWDSQVVKLSGG